MLKPPLAREERESDRMPPDLIISQLMMVLIFIFHSIKETLPLVKLQMKNEITTFYKIL